MKRLAVGSALGGLAVYLYDPQLGAVRRERLSSLWRENRETAVYAGRVATHAAESAVNAGRVAAQAAESARPVALRMTKAVSRGGSAAFDRGRRGNGLPWLLGAVAIGGAAVYFLTPVKGAERRQRLLSAWRESQHATMESGRQAARQAAGAVKPFAGRVNDQVAYVVEGVKSKVS
jgi:gas vesicle protein